MMRDLRRFACLFSVAALLAAIGCSKGAPEGGNTAPAATGAEQSENKASEKTRPTPPPALPDMTE